MDRTPRPGELVEQAETHYHRYEQSGDPDELRKAADLYDRAVELQPEGETPLFWSAMTHASLATPADLEIAEERIEAMRAAHGGSGFTAFAAGVVSLAAAEHDADPSARLLEAIRNLQTAAESFGHDPNSRIWLSSALLRASRTEVDPQTASDCARRALTASLEAIGRESSAHAHRAAAEALDRLRELTEGDEHYQVAERAARKWADAIGEAPDWQELRGPFAVALWEFGRLVRDVHGEEAAEPWFTEARTQWTSIGASPTPN